MPTRPTPCRVVLETLREVTPGRLICVFGAGGQRDREKRPLMARAVEQRADVAVVTNDNPAPRAAGADRARNCSKGFRRPHEVEVLPGSVGSDRLGVVAGRSGRLRADRRQGTRNAAARRQPGHRRTTIVRSLENGYTTIACQLKCWSAPGNAYAPHDGLQLLLLAQLFHATHRRRSSRTIGRQASLRSDAADRRRATLVGPVVIDSREVKPEEVFWGLVGARYQWRAISPRKRSSVARPEWSSRAAASSRGLAAGRWK